MKNTYSLHIGILLAEQIDFELHGLFQYNGNTISGKHTCSCSAVGLKLDDRQTQSQLLITPTSDNDFFEIHNVVIGINFHWQRQETQRFKGALRLIVENNQVRAINILDIEEYLKSVISSEMSATSSLELLKAHAIISRSWVLYPIVEKPIPQHYPTATRDRLIKWYERDAHRNFDVCSDDHCQRYQGITRIVSQHVSEAIEQTRGLVLKYNGHIADARFYKCCGGATEHFSNAWDNRDFDYLTTLRDFKTNDLPDLTQENEARKWIMSSPEAFCNTTDKAVLSQVLNNYDQETADFYRWTIRYSQNELSALIEKKSGINFGTITALNSIKRGPSGRLIELEIVGTKCTMTIGKELEIRRWLSPTHLYSSAFIVERNDNDDFILHGAGWGHGVGLCQIGAAMMAHQGYNYQQILMHYFPHTNIETL